MEPSLKNRKSSVNPSCIQKQKEMVSLKNHQPSCLGGSFKYYFNCQPKPKLGKIPILTMIFFQRGWFNHQLVNWWFPSKKHVFFVHRPFWTGEQHVVVLRTFTFTSMTSTTSSTSQAGWPASMFNHDSDWGGVQWMKHPGVCGGVSYSIYHHYPPLKWEKMACMAEHEAFLLSDIEGKQVE